MFTAFRVFWDRIRKAADPVISRISALMASYVASYIIICFSDNLGYYLVFNWYFWFFIGLAMVGINLKNEESKMKTA